MQSPIAIRLLGPIELQLDGTPVSAGGPTQRAVLAMLALHAGEPVAADTLLEGLWGESDEPLGGTKAIQVHISRLRHLLQAAPGSLLATVPGGYRMDPAEVEIDVADFERLLASGRQQLAAGDAEASATTLGRALALWRGPALMDVRDFPFAAVCADRYDELRVDAAEELNAACLSLGEAQALLPRLHALVAEHPYRERLHGQLMLALYRSGQQAAALDAYQAARSRLALDLGVDPGPELQYLQRQILEQAPELDRPDRRSAPEPPVAGFPSGPPARIPSPARLFGREEQLQRLAGLVVREHLITLTGAGGSGKTALAINLLHRMAPDFGGGPAFVDLASVGRREDVLPAIADALGVTHSGGHLGERLAQFLAERRCLVVIDNCEHLLDAVPDLTPLIDATAGAIVATSRAPLGLGAEYCVEVAPLVVPDADAVEPLMDTPAVDLFRHASAAGGVAVGSSPDELAAVASICRAVDGLPLALEIAAGQTRVESVEELAAGLEQRLPGLRNRARHGPARQRTMDAAVGWSVERLAPLERSAFARLAVFAGTFTTAGAAAVLSLDREQAVGVVGALMDVSLLTRQPSVLGQARLRMLEPVRTVARAGASVQERDDAAARHAAFVLSEIDRACPPTLGIQRPEDLEVLRADHPNLMATIAYLARTDPNRCAACLFQLRDYWQWTAREAESKHLAEDLMSSRELSRDANCRAQCQAALSAMWLGRTEDARAALRFAAASVDRTDAYMSAYVAFLRAMFEGWAVRGSRARTFARTALRIARRIGNDRLVAASLTIASMTEEDNARAENMLRRAVATARDASLPLTEILALTLLSGQIADRDPAGAADLLHSVLAIADRYRAPEAVVLPVNNLAWLLTRAGAPDEARPLLLPALRSADRAGHSRWVLDMVDTIGELEMTSGSWENGLTLVTAAETLADRLGIASYETPDVNAYVTGRDREAERRLGPDAAAGARDRGRAMSYREAVDLALSVLST